MRSPTKEAIIASHTTKELEAELLTYNAYIRAFATIDRSKDRNFSFQQEKLKYFLEASDLIEKELNDRKIGGFIHSLLNEPQ